MKGLKKPNEIPVIKAIKYKADNPLENIECDCIF